MSDGKGTLTVGSGTLPTDGTEGLCATHPDINLRTPSALPPENPCASGTCTDYCGYDHVIKTITFGEIDRLCTSSAVRQVLSHSGWNESNTSVSWARAQKCSHPYSVRRSAPRPDALLLEVTLQIMCIPLSGCGSSSCEVIA